MILKSVTVAVLTAVLLSGCTEECEETELGHTINVSFNLEAYVLGSNETELAFKTVEFRIYKEPCGQPPKGQFGWTGITDGTGYSAGGGYASYNIDNNDDLIVATATLTDGDNPSQTKTPTFRASQLTQYNTYLKTVKFYFNI